MKKIERVERAEEEMAVRRVRGACPELLHVEAELLAELRVAGVRFRDHGPAEQPGALWMTPASPRKQESHAWLLQISSAV